MEKLDLKISNSLKHIAKPVEVEPRFSPEQKGKLAKASKDFESMLTSLMLKSMNKTTGGMFGENSYGGDVLDTVFQGEIASHMTEKQGFGIAQQIYKKMTGEDLSDFIIKERPTIKSFAKIAERKIDKTDHAAIAPSNSAKNRLNKYDPIIADVSKKFGVPKNLIKSIILTESAAKENALSSANAKGLMQLIDSTAADMGVRNVWNPKENISGGTKYISKMLDRYDGDIEKSLAAYNAGPANVDKYGGIPPFDETQNYVKRVLGYLNYME